jgi:hypothetical protein
MIVDTPIRSRSRAGALLSGLGASRYESHPELLRQAEAIGNAAGFPTSCRETIEWTPGGNYFNRQCAARCSQSYVHDGFNADLIVADNGFTFVPEIRSICAAAAKIATPVTPPVYTPPPVNQPVYTPPPVNQPVYTPPPVNQPANTTAPAESNSLASRIWKKITAGDAGSATGGSLTTNTEFPAVGQDYDIPLWVWIAAAAAAGWFLTRNQK